MESRAQDLIGLSFISFSRGGGGGALGSKSDMEAGGDGSWKESPPGLELEDGALLCEGLESSL